VTTWRWERFTPLAGILAVVLGIIGLLIASADAPDEDAPASEYLSYYQGETNSIIAGTFIWMLGVLFFIVFLGALRDRLHVAEGGAGRWTAVAYATGIATAIFLISMQVPDFAGAFGDEDLEGSTGQTFAFLRWGFFFAAELTGALFLLATSLVLWTTRALPWWFAALGVLIGVLMLIPPIGWAGLVWGLPLWVVLGSVLLFWWAGRERRTAVTAPPPPP
jgi:hypothetical protein